ncbi:MAG: hypothetical protein IPK52_09700 [Chloroflexi bacterium]|nr:hypothetical protein [Chloroflexota bacterium]
MSDGKYVITTPEPGIIYAALEGDITSKLFEEFGDKRIESANTAGFREYVLIVDTTAITRTDGLNVPLLMRMTRSDPRMQLCIIMGKMLLVQVAFKVLRGVAGVRFEMIEGSDAAFARAHQVLQRSAADPTA